MLRRFLTPTPLLILVAVYGSVALAEDELSAEAASSLAEWLEASGSLALESAVGTARGRSQKLELVFGPEAEMTLSSNFRLTVIGRARGDAFDRLEPGTPSQDAVSDYSRRVPLGDRAEIELREFYLEADLGRNFLTIGKQQIVWGQADGLKVLDVVNPQVFREFILDDFAESRIPLWSVSAEIPIDPLVLQLVWIPDTTYHDFPEPGALYAFTSPRLVPPPPPGLPVEMRPVDRPGRFFADSDAGFQLSTTWKGWDLTFNYLYHYDDTPALFRQISTSPGGPVAVVTPRYRRTHLVGGTFGKAIADLTIRGELGSFLHRSFSVSDVANVDGVVTSDELTYVLGLDWYGLEESLVSIQLLQSWVIDDASGLLRDQIETNITLLLRREFLNDSLIVETMWLQGLNRGDGLLRPRISYELNDSTTVWLGLDVFYGSRDGLFGQFDGNDRVVVGIEWGF